VKVFRSEVVIEEGRELSELSPPPATDEECPAKYISLAMVGKSTTTSVEKSLI
jgi:hypothetical protein